MTMNAAYGQLTVVVMWRSQAIETSVERVNKQLLYLLIKDRL